MCGIVGVITKKPNGFSKQQQEIFTTLLFVDTLRGRDSTGVFVVNNEGDVYVAKDEGMAPYFLTSKEYTKAMDLSWSRGAAMIGHNRAATRGLVNDENAHPFNVDNNIVLVHNGTMRGDHKKHADVEVDSHAIAHLIHEKESVQEALSSFDAAYALVWYDVKNAVLSMIRNVERPLFFMEVEDAWVICSERSMLNFAAERVGAKIVTQPTMLSPDMLQKFTLKDRRWEVTDEKVEVKKPQYQGYTAGERGAVEYDQRWGPGWEDWEGGSSCAQEVPFRPSGAASSIQEALERSREKEDRARESAWEGMANRGSGGIQLLPRPQQQQKGVQRIVDAAARLVDQRQPPEFADVVDREREMAIKQNKRITHKHYTAVLNSHPYNTTVHCQPFWYDYANGKDNEQGYYLYAHPFDDEDVIIRHWFAKSGTTEERMIQLAGCDYVYEFTLGLRSWHQIDPNEKSIVDETQGFVIIRSTGAKLISTGAQKMAH